MNTQEFLATTGIPYASSITYYIDSGIIKPQKVKGRNEFSDEDVEKVVKFRLPGNKQQHKQLPYPPVMAYDLSTVSTEQLEYELKSRKGNLK